MYTETDDPGCWAMGTNTVKRCAMSKIIFCTGLTRVAKEGSKSIVPARRTQWTNQGRTPIICRYSRSTPSCLSVNSQQRPPLSSLSGRDPNKTTAKKEELQIVPNEPNKEGPLSYGFQESLFDPVSTVRRGHQSLVSLGRDPNKTTAKKEEL